MNIVKTINVCGLSCPQPALRTQQALSSLKSGTVEVMVDSATARDNVVRTAQKAGWEASILDQADGSFQISLKK